MAGKSYFGTDVPEIAVKSLLSKYDVDSNGRLGKKELMALFEDDLGMDPQQAETSYLLVDTDGSGSVTLQEFMAWLRSGENFRNIDDSSRYTTITKAVEFFKDYDTDGNGVIEKAEFGKLMAYCGVDSSQNQSALQALDKTGDGKISFAEFLKWLNWLPTKQWETGELDRPIYE